ncbi:ABC transporter ATP-binding protein [Bacillus sp. FJAT-26390]|uniref:ABC transporter ATP-binding protein n=1 Tax=Bacillus sp. FJAT-26390 TaxID=1743142 RepID=UPI000ACED847|nr:ABC transporter ATP-binding protein [Bacillus sp. FJAT-26390]
MMKPVLSVTRLHKKIRGKTIIHDVSFEVNEGEIFGFLGPNGSGKTTTIRMLVDLIKPTSGEVYIGGYHVHKEPERALSLVGCIVENPEVYAYLTGFENLAYFARMMKGIDEARIWEVIRIVRLEERIHEKVRTYSLGMRQRLGIAQALLGKPKLLILDEPTNGLDPKGIKELREFVRMLANDGMSVFISSHLLSEIQLMCDRVAIINGGRVLAEGKVDDLVEQASGYVIWQLDKPELGKRVLEGNREIAFIKRDSQLLDESMLAGMPDAIITTMDTDQIPGSVEQLVERHIGVMSVHQVAPTLEELFLTLTEGETSD